MQPQANAELKHQKDGWNPLIFGGLDFAGGAALAISISFGKRRGYGTECLTYIP